MLCYIIYKITLTSRILDLLQSQYLYSYAFLKIWYKFSQYNYHNKYFKTMCKPEWLPGH